MFTWRTHSCQIRSRSDLKRRSLWLCSKRVTQTTRWVYSDTPYTGSVAGPKNKQTRENTLSPFITVLVYIVHWHTHLLICVAASAFIKCSVFSKDKGTVSHQWRTLWHSYAVSLAIWDRTVLSATRHKWTHPALTPVIQAGTRLTRSSRRDGRMSWPKWLVTFRDGLPARRRSPTKY